MRSTFTETMARTLKIFLMSVALVSCSSERPADQEWNHSQYGSYAAAFSPDSRYVLVGDTDLPAKLWDLKTNKIKYSWQNKSGDAGTTTSVGFSGDGKVAATCEQDTVVLWNMADGKPMVRIKFPVNVKAMALSPHGDFLLLALYDRTAVYFDINKNRVVYIFKHDGAPVHSPIDQLINAVAISPDGKYALTGGDDQTARLWNLQNGQQVHMWKHQNSVNLVSFYPKGGFVITGAGNGQTHMWDMNTGDLVFTLRSSPWPAKWPLPDFPVFTTTTSAINYSPDNQYIVTGHPDQRICIWKVKNGDKVECWKVSRRQALKPGVVLQAVAFSADGKAVYSESGNGIGEKWTLK